MPETSYYLVILYSLIYLSMVLLQEVVKSKKYRAAWFYKIMPNRKPGELLSGMLKALLVKFHLPATVAALTFILYVWGSKVVLNILLALVIMLLTTVVFACRKVKQLPFSQPVEMKDKSAKLFYLFLFFFFLLGLGMAHYAISGYSVILIVLCVLFAVITLLVFRKYKRLEWADLN